MGSLGMTRILADPAPRVHKGDLVEFMVYPGEFHYFDRSFVVRDAWTRVDNFFRKHLKPELATTKK